MKRADGTLQCHGKADCKEPITHIDSKGFIYCSDHVGQSDRYRRYRKLRPHELRRLQRGLCLQRY